MYDLYRYFVKERHRMWARRMSGEPAPWTNDSILKWKKFCHDYRLLDRGSQFVITDLLEPEIEPVDVLARCFLYRVTNLPRTWEHMRSVIGRYPLASDMNTVLMRIIQEYRDAGNTVFSGAYMIIPQPGKTGDKVQHAVELTRTFLDEHAEYFFAVRSQEQRHAALQAPYGMGRFLAMQVLTDYGYSAQCGVDRENDFIVDGPGSRRGAKKVDQDKKPVALIRYLTKMWQDDDEVRLLGRPLSMMDVQNTLCEFDKWTRWRDKGLSSERIYTGIGNLPQPVIPQHLLQTSATDTLV